MYSSNSQLGRILNELNGITFIIGYDDYDDLGLHGDGLDQSLDVGARPVVGDLCDLGTRQLHAETWLKYICFFSFGMTS